MSDSQPQAKIRGIPQIPSITQVNVRGGPTTETDIVFKIQVGMSGLTILEVRPDSAGNHKDGKTYQWFKLQFHGGAVGWVRDDLLEVKGDLSAYDYDVVNNYTFAFDLIRDGQPAGATAMTTEATDDTDTGTTEAAEPAPEVPVPDDIDRVRRVAFLITGAFEGGAYDAYNNYDAGIVSYGIIQFTLAAGSLATVIQRYVSRSDSEQANQLEKYLARVNARDTMLRTDTGFRDALIAAAQDEVMRTVQDEVAAEGFWQRIIDGYITHRGLVLPLSWALLFDMGVNFGPNHGFVQLAERQLGVPPRSKPGQNGITEQQLIERVVLLRKQSHYRQAEEHGLWGLKRRADFWTGLIERGDWYLRGNAHGKINANGRIVDTRNP
jgi:hypothetical protein